MANFLSQSSSPYLLQHKTNPVEWYEWSDKAFEQSRLMDKPIFLSIGYATCHWCHVMAHESFEDTEVADRMNEVFINIKVDREELPAIDHLYMTVCQLMTGSGGWPLTIIMTPNKEPFFAGTYFPKNSVANRVGMIDLIASIQDTWCNHRDKIHDSVSTVMRYLKSPSPNHSHSLDLSISEQAVSQFSHDFDPVHGGFGSAPKFPSPHQLEFLMAYYSRTQSDHALLMVERTLLGIVNGGIHDVLGKGFHRYAVDSEWKVPHFEKMLYDQCMLMRAFALAYDETRNELYKSVVLDIVSYVTERLMHPEGAFYSAEDADTEGEEGRYYSWTSEELQKILTKEEYILLQTHYSIEDTGNYNDEALHMPVGKNILHRVGQSISSITDSMDSKHLQDIHKKLLLSRNDRVAPLLDHKILTDWNGLVIASLSLSSRCIDDESLIERAIKCWGFIQKYLIDDTTLYHRYCDGDVGISAHLFDYQFLVLGLLELYSATLRSDFYYQAVKWFDRCKMSLWNDEDGTYMISCSDDLIVHQSDHFDGALPSGNSVAYYNGLKIGQLSQQLSISNDAQRLIDSNSSYINQLPTNHAFWLAAFERFHYQSAVLVIIGSISDRQKNQLLRYRRLLVMLHHESPQSNRSSESIVIKRLNNRTTYYYCQNFTCSLPTNSFKKCLDLIKASESVG